MESLFYQTLALVLQASVLLLLNSNRIKLWRITCTKKHEGKLKPLTLDFFFAIVGIRMDKWDCSAAAGPVW